VSESAEVVIVGGGVMGASVAYHLTTLGVTDIVLLEGNELASGSTSKSAGGIRAQFADELNVRIALRSIEEFTAFAELVGADIDFHQAGYLFLLDDEQDAARFRAALELQHSLGVPSREIPADEAGAIVPGLETADLLAATFCPIDGYATPEAVVQGYAAAARRAGARIRQGEPVTGIEVANGRITGAATAGGRISTAAIVCAAGAWSGEVAGLAGVDLPVRGERRFMHYTPDSGGLPRSLPLTVDFSTGFYFHSEGPGLVFGGREEALEAIAEHAARRLPLLTELPVQASWSGFYEMSPDHNAIVGATADPQGFLYATGFSGHGFQQAPAVGEHVAELIAGREPSLDLAAFSLERFARGDVREEHFVI
jgi:glycine/D-amino acid oxidase-like deaminating enzyme